MRVCSLSLFERTFFQSKQMNEIMAIDQLRLSTEKKRDFLQ